LHNYTKPPLKRHVSTKKSLVGRSLENKNKILNFGRAIFFGTVFFHQAAVRGFVFVLVGVVRIFHIFLVIQLLRFWIGSEVSHIMNGRRNLSSGQSSPPSKRSGFSCLKRTSNALVARKFIGASLL
jgi:hypothetical protein